ncbi:MAG: hypothetical protein Athens101410_788 [Parcubacteria group bacterium Athens1014_10]|nr:MAG: hypothetical protein Athens101410_788 [Parcubacteria group bacterium Athens1014_10]
MTKILIHKEIFDDAKLVNKKKWYIGLGNELPRIFSLLICDGELPGESPMHYIKSKELLNKVFHAGINLPQENTGKRKEINGTTIRAE